MGQLLIGLVFFAAVVRPTAAVESRAPPMGWRSWYAGALGGHSPTQQGLEIAAAVLKNRSRLVEGKPTSLADVGYNRVGLDDGWQNCTGGINGSFHDANGEPVLNKTAFPNIAAFVDSAHAQGLKAGFYMNNFICRGADNSQWKTPEQEEIHMRGNAQWLARNKFDEVKVDSGGKFNDMSWWARELKATGRDIAVESCHQGHLLPNASWCPFQMWKTSGDPAVTGWQTELLDTAQMLNRSRPGCWAYPGYAAYSAAMGRYNDSRTQFGIHAIISSPLVLSFDISNDERLDAVWDILTNKEAIAINQNWAGSAGMLIKKWNPQETNTTAPKYVWGIDCTEAADTKWSYDKGTGSVRATTNSDVLCMEKAGSASWISGGLVGLRTCNSSSPLQQFAMTADGHLNFSTGIPLSETSPGPMSCVTIQQSRLTTGPAVQLTRCSKSANQQFTLQSNGALSSAVGYCLAARHGEPNNFGPLQLWAKPQPNGAAAALVINMASDTWGHNNVDSYAVSLDLKSLPGLQQQEHVKVRDIWAKKDLPDAAGHVQTDSILPGDSRFFLFSPN